MSAVALGVLLLLPAWPALPDSRRPTPAAPDTGQIKPGTLPDDAQLKIILSHPQLVVARDAAGRFTAQLCRCAVPVSAADIPATLRRALIDTEDRRFYAWYHGLGIDPFGLGAAIEAQFTGRRRGGSSLNQQIAKNLVVGNRNSYWRKAQELVLAARIEHILSKNDIIAVYLNTADFGAKDGQEIIGIEQASRAWFGKSTHSLNLYETAVLVGMLNGPTAYNPLRHPAAARARATLVLARMQGQGDISRAQAATALRIGPRPGRLRPVPLETGYYVDWVLHALQQHADQFKDMKQLRLVIGLDPHMQLNAQMSIADLLRRAETAHARQAALIAMEADGTVRALVGGRDFRESQFDRATMARRSPGSTFKPFVYLRALETGRQPTDPVLDEPFSAVESRRLHVPPGWPANFEHRYAHAEVPLRQALAMSLNAATVRLALEVGLPGIVETAHRLGIGTAMPTDDPSVALGASAVIPMEMTAAYAAFLNGGYRVRPHGIVAIVSMDGRMLAEDGGLPGPRVITPTRARTMAEMLHTAVKTGTGWRADFGAWVAGKTGTSQDNRDAWFIGFDHPGDLLTTVWLGNDDNSPMRDVSGGTLPAETWRRFYISLGHEHGTLPRRAVVAKR
jgi:penicillin-binding protein 1A